MAMEERCIERADVDALAQADTEWIWRLGWRRAIPGSADALRAALRPLQPPDDVLRAYTARYPKTDEAPYPPDPERVAEG